MSAQTSHRSLKLNQNEEGNSDAVQIGRYRSARLSTPSKCSKRPSAPPRPLVFDAAVAGAPANPPASSGSWVIVPGLLTINWTYKAADNQVAVAANVLWFTIDTLTGTLTKAAAILTDTVDILDVITGSLSLDAEFAGTPAKRAGFWVSGSLDVFAKNWKFEELVLPW